MKRYWFLSLSSPEAFLLTHTLNQGWQSTAHGLNPTHCLFL